MKRNPGLGTTLGVLMAIVVLIVLAVHGSLS